MNIERRSNFLAFEVLDRSGLVSCPSVCPGVDDGLSLSMFKVSVVFVFVTIETKPFALDFSLDELLETVRDILGVGAMFGG